MDQVYAILAAEIENGVKSYLQKSKLKSVVMGISGGLDSGLNAIIIKRVCDSLEIPFYGYFLQIETNKKEESDRADAIGKCFCTHYKNVDLTETYLNMLNGIEDNASDLLKTEEIDYFKKIRRGNIKARLRMIYLYDKAQIYNGLVIDNDNRTEQLLGFFTLHGDVGDLTPLAYLMKTEVYSLARYYHDNILTDPEEKAALMSVINCVPTDGLGITSSDVEQFGVKTYDEVDDILNSYLEYHKSFRLSLTWKYQYESLCKKYGQDAVDKVVYRHLSSAFKRENPYRIKIHYEN